FPVQSFGKQDLFRIIIILEMKPILFYFGKWGFIG
ncbi:uncharacterized protein METZ01_LOCUS363194, partial [marine metagenome]